MPKRKVKVVQIAIAHAPAGADGAKPGSHVALLDSRGRVFERYSDMAVGSWGEVELPSVAQGQSKRRGRKR